MLAWVGMSHALTAPSWAQSTFGSFVGTVQDPSGSVIANCVVNAQNQGTAAKRSVVTDANGSYVLVNLEPGTYEITMLAPGFGQTKHTNLQLLARQAVRVDATLSLASQVETVNVSVAAEAVITTESSSIAETKTSRELLELPVAIGSRASGSTSPISTLTTQPGVQTDGSGNISVAGAKPGMLSVSVDGISSMNPRNSAPISELFPSFSTIAEIRVSEINNAAEYGGVSDITTISRGGTNAFHGEVFENLQNTALNARNPFSATKPKLNMNNFGGYLGGPVRIPKLYNGRDRTFFFFAYEGLRLPREQLINHSVPSLALRNGDLSAYPAAVIKDPTTGLPFPNNQIPASSISPISRAVLTTLFPLPNTGSPTAIANNYRQNFPTPISSNQGDLRLDQNISANQTVFARFTYKKRDVQDPPAATSTVFSGAIQRPEYVSGLTVAHNFVISPQVVNEIRGGYNGTRSYSSSGLVATDVLAQLGLTRTPDPPPGSGSPNFNITGFQQTGATTSAFSKGETIQILDNLTWNKGKHTLKFGGDFRHLTGYFSNVFAGSRTGVYTFNGSVTNSIIGHPFASFLLGVPDRTQVATVIAPDTHSYSNHWAFYAQDDWKVTPRLTVNFGLRWEYHPAFKDHLNNIANFLPDYQSTVNGVAVNGAVVVPDQALSLINPNFAATIAPTPFLTATQAGLPQSLHQSKRTNFAPRIGLAWRPFADGKTVIRGGYGRYIETLLSALITAGWAVEASNVGLYNQQIVNGSPTLRFPYPFPANLSLPGTATFEYSSDVKYRDPYVHQWNLTVERDLGLNMGVRLTYDGSHGADLGLTLNANQVAANTQGFAVAGRAAPFPQFATVTRYTNGGRSNYNALTAALNKRFSHGLQFQTSYAFAKNLSNGGGFNPTGFASEAGGRVTDRFNYDLDYGNVAYTRRHRFLTTFLWDVPVGRNRAFLNKMNGVVDQVLGGWQLSGVLVFQSGPFLTVLAPTADPAGNNFPNIEGAGRADIISGASLYPAEKTITQWINPAAFAVPRNNIGRPGNSPVGAVTGPGTQAVSLSLLKVFAIRENVRLQIGAGASNALNHQNYAIPNLNYGTPAFGTITNLQVQEGAGPRSVQLTARLSF